MCFIFLCWHSTIEVLQLNNKIKRAEYCNVCSQVHSRSLVFIYIFMKKNCNLWQLSSTYNYTLMDQKEECYNKNNNIKKEPTDQVNTAMEKKYLQYNMYYVAV